MNCCLTTISTDAFPISVKNVCFVFFSFHFRTVCTVFLDGREMNVKPVSSPGYRQNLIGAFGGVAFGRPEKLRDGNWPRGTSLRWEGKPPCSRHEYITHHMHWVTAGLLPPPPIHQNALQCSPDYIWPSRPWWMIFVKNTVEVTLFHSPETGPVMSQAPQKSLVFILPHQSRCPLSWKLRTEERKRQSDTVCIDIFWRMNKIKSSVVEMQRRALSLRWNLSGIRSALIKALTVWIELKRSSLDLVITRPSVSSEEGREQQQQGWEAYQRIPPKQKG